MRAGGQSVQKARAGGDQIEAPGAFRSNLVLHDAGGGRKQHVRRDRAYQNAIQLGGVDPALIERHLRRAHRQIRSRHLRRGDMTLGDSRTVQDPLIAGLHHLFQFEVGQYTGWRVATQRGNFGFRQCPSQLSEKLQFPLIC